MSDRLYLDVIALIAVTAINAVRFAKIIERLDIVKASFCQSGAHIIDIDPKLVRGQFYAFGIFIGNAFIGGLARGRGVFSGNNTNAVIIGNDHIARKDDLSGADNWHINRTGGVFNRAF